MSLIQTLQSKLIALKLKLNIHRCDNGARFFPVILFCFCSIFYFRACSYEFLNWDDDFNIVKNPLLNQNQILWFWTHVYYDLYIPLTYTVWGLCVTCFHRMNPHDFHALNVFIHALNSVQVFFILSHLLGQLEEGSTGMSESSRERGRKHLGALSAFLGALLFAVHPLQVGAVAWISGLRDLLSAAFALAAVQVFLKERTKKGRRAGLLFFFTLGLAAKPSIITLPLVLALLNKKPFYEKREKLDLLSDLAPLILVALPSFFLTASIQTSSKFTHYVAPFYLRPLIAIDSLGFYFSKILNPTALAVDYGRTSEWVLSQQAWLASLSKLILLGLVFLGIQKRLSHKLLIGFQFFVLALLPVLGIFSYSFQAISNVSDHYAYFGMVGVSLIFAFFSQYLLVQKAHYPLILLVAALLALMLLSQLRIPAWANNSVFYETWMKDNPKSTRGFGNASSLALQRGDLQAAESLSRKALSLAPFSPVPATNLASVYLQRNDYEKALYEVMGFLKNPEFIRVNQFRPYHLSFVYHIAGEILEKLGRQDEAFSYYCQSARMHPGTTDRLLRGGPSARRAFLECR